jgi:hypothetical protein
LRTFLSKLLEDFKKLAQTDIKITLRTKEEHEFSEDLFTLQKEIIEFGISSHDLFIISKMSIISEGYPLILTKEITQDLVIVLIGTNWGRN